MGQSTSYAVKLTVIISYYKAEENLLLILKGLNRQSVMNFEVIVSEDDNNPETAPFLEKIKPDLKYSLKHIHQEQDLGFRKNSMLNRAVSTAESERLVFIDGDCIPHKQFVKQYLLNINEDTICIGRSVMLGETFTENLKKTVSLEKLTYFKLLFSDSNKVKECIYSPWFSLSYKTRGLVGRNWGVHKSSLVKINGFDEDYVQAGIGEDVDIEWRLMDIGLKRKSVKNKAIVYHIYHKRWYSSEIERKNYDLMQEKIKLGNIKCLNGIEKLY